MKPLAIDLYCGLGGWAEGFLSEGYEVVGFDIERHVYHVPDGIEDGGGSKGTRPVKKRGWTQGCAVSLGLEGVTARPRTKRLEYPGHLVLQDVRTLHGSQFRNAAVIVGSSPCQEFSYRAMPWKRAKALPPPELGMELFEAQFRIQREACEAAGRYIPMVVENVKGAQKWVGRAAWHFGSYYLWGDVPALMPFARSHAKIPGQDWNRFKSRGEVSPHWRMQAIKNAGAPQGTWFGRSHGKDFPKNGGNPVRQSTITAERKAASAQIAKIPYDLAQYIARTYKPSEEMERTA